MALTARAAEERAYSGLVEDEDSQTLRAMRDEWMEWGDEKREVRSAAILALTRVSLPDF
jgi:hypothetical protein